MINPAITTVCVLKVAQLIKKKLTKAILNYLTYTTASMHSETLVKTVRSQVL